MLIPEVNTAYTTPTEDMTTAEIFMIIILKMYFSEF